MVVYFGKLVKQVWKSWHERKEGRKKAKNGSEAGVEGRRKGRGEKRESEGKECFYSDYLF